jgi:hypothetical protein
MKAKGAIFEQTKEKAVMYSLGERLWGLFLELVKIIEVLFDGCDSDDIIHRLLENEQACRNNWSIACCRATRNPESGLIKNGK